MSYKSIVHKISKGIKENKLLLLSIMVLTCYFAPFIIAGENSNIVIHDNLDSAFNFYVLMWKFRAK